VVKFVSFLVDQVLVKVKER